MIPFKPYDPTRLFFSLCPFIIKDIQEIDFPSKETFNYTKFLTYVAKTNKNFAKNCCKIIYDAKGMADIHRVSK
jgi:hypothetical protein